VAEFLQCRVAEAILVHQLLLEPSGRHGRGDGMSGENHVRPAKESDSEPAGRAVMIVRR
jgi:hypothetical protein